MNCTFDKEKLTGYYDGELDAAEKADVERHIASCSECLRELGELKSAALLVKELPRLRAPRSIAEGVTREIQAAGKVHRFAVVRRNVLWACAAAAGLLVALNVVYFTSASRSESPALARPAAAPTSIANAKAPEPLGTPAKDQQDAAARRGADRGEQLERGRRIEELRKAPLAEEKALEAKSAEPARKSEAEAPRPAAPAEKAAAAPVVRAEPKPAADPAPAPPPKPAPPAALPPAPAAPVPAEPRAAAELAKKDEGGAKEGVKAKQSVELQGEAAPTHLTLASTQMSKARPVMEETLRKMGVTLPGASPAPLKAPSAKTFRDESSLTLELTDSQIARLRQELEKSGNSMLLAAAPGDPVLAQFGDGGIFREKKSVASGGAPTARSGKPADAPKVPESTKGVADAKEKEKDARENEDLAKSVAEGLTDKAREVKRKVVLHLVEVASMPDSRPAPDTLKK